MNNREANTRYYGSSKDREKRVDAPTVIDFAKKIVEKFKNLPAKKKVDNKGLSGDIKEAIEHKPTIGEFAKILREQTKNQDAVQNIPRKIDITQETQNKIIEKLYKKDASGNVVPIESRHKVVDLEQITDERTGQLALKLLDIEEIGNSQEKARKITEALEEMWKYRVGSGYKNTAAEEVRSLMWRVEKNVSQDTNTYRLDDNDIIQLQKDIAVLLKTSTYPPQLEIPESNSNFSKEPETISLVDKFNSNTADFIYKDGFVVELQQNFDKTDVTEAKQKLDQAWKAYVDKKNRNDVTIDDWNTYSSLDNQLKDLETDILDGEEETFRDQYLSQHPSQRPENQPQVRIPSEFQLSEEEAIKLLQNPIAELESIMSKIEAGILNGGIFEDPTIQSIFKRYNLSITVLSANTFPEDAFKHLVKPGNLSREKLEESFKEYQNSYSRQRELFLKEMDLRIKGIKLLPVLANATGFTDQNLLNQIANLSENFFVEYPTAAGGVVEDVNDILTTNAMKLIRGKHGPERRLKTEQIQTAIEATKKEMIDHKESYIELYKDYINGSYYQIESGSDAAQLSTDSDAEQIISYEDFVNAVVNRAAIYKYIWMDWDILESRGLTPRKDNVLGGKTGVFDKPRKRLNALKMRRRDLEQWGGSGGKVSLMVAHNRVTAQFYADHYEHDVEHEAEHEAHRFIELMKGNSLTNKEKIAYLDDLYFWNADRWHEQWGEHEWENLLNRIQSGKADKEIYEEWRVQIGIDIADMHGLQGYSPLESVWRSDQVRQVMERIFSSIFGSNNLDKFFTAGKLIKAGKELSDGKLSHKHGIEVPFYNTVKEVAKYRPHNFADMMLEMKDETFLHWFEHAGIGDDANKTLSDMNLIVAKVNRFLFRDVMKETDRNRTQLYVPLDFSDVSTWNEKQKTMFDKVLQTMGYDTPEKKKKMTDDFVKLHQFITSDKALKRLSNVRYERVIAFSGPRWQDDLPMVLLQHPDRLKFLTPEERGSTTTLGQYISGLGIEEWAGPFKRMFKENAQLEEAAKAYPMIYAARSQELTKLLMQLHAGAAGVNGAAAGALAREEEEYTWNKMRELRTGILGFKRGANTREATLFKKYSGNQASDIVYPEEAHHMQGLHNELMSNSGEFISAVIHTKEENLGMSAWKKILPENGIIAQMLKARYGEHEGLKKYEQFISFMDDMYPSKILRDKMLKFGLYALLITGLFLFIKIANSATEELKVAAGQPMGGGSHGGGHGGGH